MTKRRVIAYVDGFNFYYRRLRNKPYRWLDLVALFESLFPDDEIVEVKYFTAQVTGKFDAQKPLRQQTYLRALGTLPKLTIVMGQFITTAVRYRPEVPVFDDQGLPLNSVSVWRPEEKGSDVNLGSHLLNDAWSDAFDVAAVLTNDTDLAVPVKFAAARDKTVLIIHPDSNPALSLVKNATASLHLHDSHLRDAQLPNELTLPNGKKIRKPNGF
jgi:uncharacterized LabA/DUF88 family protein